jgi:hypothetical protein
MQPIEFVNATACLLLLLYLLPAAKVARDWRHKLPLVALALTVAMQMTDPAVGWLPSVAWPTVVFNVALAVCITVWRRDLWRLVQSKFDPESAPRTRAGDRKEARR